MTEQKLIFYDNASTTRVDEEILKLYDGFQRECYFNPSAPYCCAVDAKNAVDAARKSILSALKGDGTVLFTASGTESDNQALFCTRKTKFSRVLIARAEHPAVYQSATELRQRGVAVDFADVDRNGRVSAEHFEELMTKDTDLVSVIHVSNETGAINEIETLVKIAKRINPEAIVHADGVQAVGKIPVDLHALGVDLYSFSGHKIHAPKGAAGLFVKKGVRLRPLLFGGGQEAGLRSSTENVGGIAALGKAVAAAVQSLPENTTKITKIKNRLTAYLVDLDPEIRFLSPVDRASPNILSFASNTVRGEVLVHALERSGIMIGTGSACSSKKASRRVPEDLSVAPEYRDGIIRLSFSKYNDENECEYFEKQFKLEYLNLKKHMRG